MNISDRETKVGSIDEEDNVDDLPFTRAAQKLWIVVSPFILLLGTFGNVMSVAVHHRLSRKRNSTISIYLIALAVSVQWLNNMLNYDIAGSSNIACKLLIWFIYASGAICAWLLVAVTLQRAMSVVWPHRVKSLITFRSLFVVFIIAGTLMLVHVHILFGWGDVVSRTSKDVLILQCTIITQGYLNFFFDRIWSWADLFLFSLVPFAVLLGSNAVLLKTVVMSIRQARHSLSVGDKQQVTSRKKTASSMTLTLMVISFTFIILTGPICVYLLMKPYLFDDVALSNEKEAVRRFVFAVINLMWYSNSAINFYLYCLSGSKFRAELRVMCYNRKQE